MLHNVVSFDTMPIIISNVPAVGVQFRPAFVYSYYGATTRCRSLNSWSLRPHYSRFSDCVLQFRRPSSVALSGEASHLFPGFPESRFPSTLLFSRRLGILLTFTSSSWSVHWSLPISIWMAGSNSPSAVDTHSLEHKTGGTKCCKPCFPGNILIFSDWYYSCLFHCWPLWELCRST